MTEYITLTPEWEATAEWFARLLSEHGFEKDRTAPVITLIEQVRYLTQTDPDAVERVIEKLRR